MNDKFTAQARKEIKRACKKSVLEHWGRCIGIQVLCAVPYILLIIILYIALFGRLFSMIAQGYTDDYRIGLAVTQGMNTVWVVIFLMLLITGPLQFGMMRFYIGLRRGEEPGAGTLFQAFSSLHALWTGVKMEFCLFFRSLLWTVGPTVIYTMLWVTTVISALFMRQEPSEAITIMLTVAYLLVMLLINIKLMTYSAGWVVLHDRPDSGAWDATAYAGRTFRGHYGKLLVFVLSFVGWYSLLAAVTWLCLLLGMAGLELIAGATGFAVFAAALVAALCLDIVLGSFVNAYFTTSFIGMYETLAVPKQAGFPPRDEENQI